MRQINVTVYSFDELNEKAKEKARDWYRGCISTDDFDMTTDSLIDDVKKLGFTDVKLYWSVAYCQGDHATLEGRWFAKDCLDYDKIKEEIQLEGFLAIAKEFHELSLLYAEGAFRFHKAHVEIIEHQPELEYVPEGAWIKRKFISATKKLNKWLYEVLRDQSDYLHSAESIDQAMSLVSYDFLEDGSRCTLGEGE